MYDTFLITNGVKIAGFDEIVLENCYYTLAGFFRLKAYDSPSVELKKAKDKIVEGNECQIKVDDNLVFTGFIDDIASYYDNSKKIIEIYGRSKSSDLIDSTSLFKEYRKQSLSAIAGDICSDFGLKVKVSGADKVINLFTVLTGENCADALIRLCKTQNKITYSNAAGDIEITDKVTEPKGKISSLTTGKDGNIIRAKSVKSFRCKFSDYVIVGQNILSDDDNLDKITAPVIAKDFSHVRFRQKVINADVVSSSFVSKEIARDNKKTFSLEVTANSWKDASDNLFSINSLINVSDEWVSPASLYRVSKASLVKTPLTGHITNLDLEVVLWLI